MSNFRMNFVLNPTRRKSNVDPTLGAPAKPRVHKPVRAMRPLKRQEPRPVNAIKMKI